MGRHIYVHNPFCISKCPYCDFYSVPCATEDLMKRYYETCIKETEYLAENMHAAEDDHPDTIYFGGGTPSYPGKELIAKLLRSITEAFSISDCEKTIEVNPSSIDEDKAAYYLECGFNRASVGVQSLSDEVLKTLGRRHDSGMAVKAIENLKKAGFTNISADLITGVPGQSLEGLVKDIRTLVSLGVTHVSTYSLMIEEGTRFYGLYKDTLEELVPPELEREMYHKTLLTLEELGFIPYEISNSAIPGFESRHNACYWDGCEYYGIGAGSHGFLGSVRYGHKDDIEDYIRDFKANCYIEEKMSLEDKMREYPFLALRTRKGMDILKFKERFGKDIHEVFEDAISKNKALGYLEESEGFIKLTLQGLDLANPVIEDFL
ncbi:MAG: radical SAM family heme chaperone HemW [Saccharofermentans sp.]|nr:radical SAM family heme chaperone HemW [Saccharofermentans sp.]